MVKNQVILNTIMKKTFMLLLFLACGVSLSAQKQIETWTTDPVDGHRTGVVASNASNVAEAMGTVKGCTYYAPNGRKFRRGTVKEVAKIMLDAQPAMAKVKTVIGYSTRAMVRTYPECEIHDWYIDELMRAVADSLDRKVDIGFANTGGIRIDMPAGEVLYDDIMSMFPFRNHICYVALRGRDVRALLDQMASKKFQIIGGVKVIAADGKIVSATVGGEPIDDDRIYGIATLDFLLDGGDGYKVANNAVEVIKCDSYLYDTMLAYVRSLTAAGKPIEFENQQWITILKENE